MKRLAQVVCVVCALATAAAQEAPDCTVGHLEIGGPAPKYNRAEYRRSIEDVSSWFYVAGATHWRTRVPPGTIYFEQFLEIKDDQLIALVREFLTDRTQDVIEALRERYGQPETPHGPWIEWRGDISGLGHLTWFDKACGIRVDAFPSADPADPDERSVVVWTKGVNRPAPSASDAVR